MNRMKKQSIFPIFSLILGCVLVILDQITKIWARSRLEGQEPIRVIDGVFHFQYLEGGNTGAAWGIFSGKTGLLIFIVAVVFLVFFFGFLKIEAAFQKNRIPQSSHRKFRVLEIILIVICAGGVGNMIDRLRLGYVIDFLYFKWIDFPIFNVADCYVTVGIAAFLIMFLFVIKDEELGTLRSKRKGS